MQNSPFLAGQFVWCAYPQRERPLTPGPRHVGYIVAMGKRPVGFGAMVAYTTTRRWSGATPLGVYAFSEVQARAMGQTKAFVLDLRRIAYIPVETPWFPNLASPSGGCIGAAPEVHIVAIEETLKTLFGRHPANVERLGPLWTG